MKSYIGVQGVVTNGPVDGTSTLIIPPLAAPSGSIYTLVVDEDGTVTSVLAPNTTASYALSTAQWRDFGNSIATTSSVAIVGELGTSYEASDVGSNVYFFVSGSPDQVSVFGGDVLVSGSMRNTSLRVSQFIELAPISYVPAHDGAPGFASTFLYTSGANSDLYVHHYNGYDNALNFRWIENNLSTGLLQGGVLSTQPGTTTFSITSGSGLFVKYNATTNQDPTTTTNVLKWPNYISQSITYINTGSVAYVGIAEDGTLIQQITPFQNSDYQNYIVLGRITYNSGSTIAASPTPKVSYGLTTWTSDFSRAFGPLKIRGHALAASGSTLGITKTAGTSYVEGRNYVLDPDSPNLVLPETDGNITTSKIYRVFVSGSDALQYTLDYGVAGAGYTYIDPTKYNLDNNGTLTSVDAGKFSIQRVFWGPNSQPEAFYVYYGPKQYATLSEAQTALASEIFVEGAITLVALIYVAAIIVRQDCSDLSDPTKALIVQGGLFRAGGIGAGGGAPSSLVVPGGINTYVQFNDGGSVFGGDSGLTYNKSTKVLTSNTTNITTNATVTKLTASVGIITPFISAGIGFKSNGTGVVATGSFTGSFTGVLTGTASFAANSNLFNSLSSSAFPRLATANTFTQNNVFTNGLSGSLQRLSDGVTPYLVGSGALSITTGSNGVVTASISSLESANTWTPALSFEGVNDGHTYSARLGTYYKIGRLVTANFIIALSSLGTSTGNVNIVNLPFTSQTSVTGTGNGPAMVFKKISNGNKAINITTYIASNSTTGSLYTVRTADTASLRLTHSELTNTTELTGSFTYIAAT